MSTDVPEENLRYSTYGAGADFLGLARDILSFSADGKYYPCHSLADGCTANGKQSSWSQTKSEKADIESSG
jgi:hypothetical protein